MRDNIWDNHDVTDHRSRTRTTTLIVLAAIPWLVVAAIVFLPDRGSDDHVPSEATSAEPVSQHAPDSPLAGSADEATRAAEDPPQSTGPGTITPEPDPPVDLVWPVDAPRQDPRVTAEIPRDDHPLVAIATMVARAWATGADPRLTVAGVRPPDSPRYAEHVAVEAIHREGGLAVVVLIAVILEHSEDGVTADLRRIAVPMVEGGEAPAIAGTPWWLPAPDFTSFELRSHPVEDADHIEAASEALRQAGYADIEVVSLHRSDHWPWIVDATALAPRGEPHEGPLWLRPTADGFVLAGSPTKEVGW